MHSNSSCDQYERLQNFADWTLNVGNNYVQGYSFLGDSKLNWREIPKEFLIKNDNNGLSNLIAFMYPTLEERYTDESYFQDSCILAPLNTDLMN